MSHFGYPLLVVVFLAMVGLQAHAQQAPKVAADAERIVDDADLHARERIDRSIMLLESRANIERKRGVRDIAEQLRRAASLLRIAPETAEASMLAAEAAVAAERGAIVEAVVLAESAAALSPDWIPKQ